MEDQNQIESSLKKICEDYWKERSLPILLSALPQILEGTNPNYRTILGHRTLKAFINETGGNAGYKLIEHPTQRARVGIAPTGAHYEFPLESPPAGVIVSKSNQGTTLAFLRALATLPDAELDKVVIPASVLIKLLK